MRHFKSKEHDKVYTIFADNIEWTYATVKGNYAQCKANIETWAEMEGYEEVFEIFKTDDGVSIFDNTTTVYGVVLNASKEWKRAERNVGGIKSYFKGNNWYVDRTIVGPLGRGLNFKWFSTNEAREKYVNENQPKPLLTTEDGIEIFDENQLVYGYHENNDDCSAIRRAGVIKNGKIKWFSSLETRNNYRKKFLKEKKEKEETSTIQLTGPKQLMDQIENIFKSFIGN